MDFKTLEAAFIAIYILLLVWFLTAIPLFFKGSINFKKGNREEEEENVVKMSRAFEAYNNARDGVLFLLVVVIISFSLQSDAGSTIALSYIYMALTIILILSTYLTSEKVILNSLRMLSYILAIVIGIIAYATASW